MNIQTGSDIHIITLCICIGSALQIRNHCQFREMTVRVDRRNCGTETSQWMIETFADTTVTKRSILVGMHEFGIHFQLHPTSQLRSNIGSKIIPFIIHIGITEDSVFRIVTTWNIILCSLTTTAQADIMILFKRPVLIMQIKIVHITDTRLRVFESRVHIGIGRQFEPRIDTARIIDILL